MAEVSKYRCETALPLTESITRLYRKAAPEPSDTRVSMLGAAESRDFVPLLKNSELIPSTAAARSSWSTPAAAQFLSRKAGSGQFHIAAPMATYIRGKRKSSDSASRRARILYLGNAAPELLPEAPEIPPAPAPPPCAEPFGLAWYPALSTAAAIASSVALPSTFIEFVTRLTEQEVTPSTFDTAFSTCATHAEQVIPSTSNCLTIS